MRNFKKLLAAIIVCAMMITLIPASFAATSASNATSAFKYEDEANTLNDLGLYKGVDPNKFVPDLGSNLTRETTVIVLLRLMAQEDNALKMEEDNATATLNSKITDADAVSSWAKKQVADAVDTGIVKGFPNGDGTISFQPKSNLTGKQYFSLILQTLGYDGDFDFNGKGKPSPAEKLAEIGGLTDELAQLSDKVLTRDDLVGISYSVLKAVIKDSDETVIAQLVRLGKVDAAKAEAAGLYTAPTATATVAPTVAPTSAPTTVPVVVYAEVYAGSVTAGQNPDGTLNVSGKTISADTVKVSITDSTGKVVGSSDVVAVEKDAFSYNTKDKVKSGTFNYTVTPVNKDGAGKPVTGTFEVKSFGITSIKAINAKEVEITFNKDVVAEKDIKENSSAADKKRYKFYQISGISDGREAQYAGMGATNNVVRLVVPSDNPDNPEANDKMLTTDKAQVVINGVKSATGEIYTSPSARDSIDVTAAGENDKDYPAVASVNCISPAYFEVVFSKAVKTFTIAADKNPAIKTCDGKNSALNPFAYSVGGRTFNPFDQYKDKASVSNPSGDCRTFLVALDPVYTERLPITNLLLSVSNINDSFTTTVYQANNLNSSLTCSAVQQQIQDWSGNALTPYTGNLNVQADSVKPTVKSVEMMSRSRLRITFSEPVDSEKVKSYVSSFKWGDASSTIDSVNNKASSVKQVFVNVFDFTFTNTNAMPASGDFKVYIAKEAVYDLAGNEMNDDYSATMTGRADEQITATAAQVKGTQKEVEVTFTDVMNSTTLGDQGNYKIDGKAISSASIVSSSTDTDNTVVNLAVTDDLTNGNHTITISNMKDQFGNVLPTFDIPVSIQDEEAPTIKDYWAVQNATVNNTQKDVLVLLFSEQMALSGEHRITNYLNYKYAKRGLTTDSNSVLTSDSKFTAMGEGKVVRIVMPANTIQNLSTDDLAIGYTAQSEGHWITDLAGNGLTGGWVITGFTSGQKIDLSTDGSAVVTDDNTITYTLNQTAIDAGKGFNNIATSDFELRIGNQIGTTSTTGINDYKLIDDDDDGIYEKVEFTVGDNTFTSNSSVELRTNSNPTGSEDLFGQTLVASKIAATSTLAPAAITNVTVTDSRHIQIRFNAPLAVNQEVYLADSISITQGNLFFSGYGTGDGQLTATAANSTRDLYTITVYGGNIDSSTSVTLKTLSSANITAIGANNVKIAENKDGITSTNTFMANQITISDANGKLFDSTSDSVVIDFNKALKLSRIVSGWNDGITTAPATTIATLGGSSAVNGGFLSIPNVGTIQGLSIAPQFNGNTVTLQLSYANVGRQLVIKAVGAGNSGISIASAANGITFDPKTVQGNSLQDASGNAISTTTSLMPSTTAVTLSPYISSIVVANAGVANQIYAGDTITITFNKAVNIASLPTGVTLDANGNLTVNGVVTFKCGTATTAGTLAATSALDATKTVLTVTITGTNGTTITTPYMGAAYVDKTNTITDTAGNSISTFAATPTGSF